LKIKQFSLVITGELGKKIIQIKRKMN